MRELKSRSQSREPLKKFQSWTSRKYSAPNV
jgi:hypothetical protein